MIIHDVNILVYAYRGDIARHHEFREAFESEVLSPAAFGYSNLVLSGFIRVVTHQRVFKVPSSVEDALSFVNAVRTQPNAVEVRPGNRHWDIFSELCVSGDARGNRVPDAYHAALAIESGAEWITTDRGFARFPHLRWRHPLD